MEGGNLELNAVEDDKEGVISVWVVLIVRLVCGESSRES